MIAMCTVIFAFMTGTFAVLQPDKVLALSFYLVRVIATLLASSLWDSKLQNTRKVEGNINAHPSKADEASK
ncbi:hypothetical protein SADUNF_Sadunf19G0085500 [Salix dunnii]|uniref:GDT1 family protein n=1 Tax=Salix dunnii TaxID=1413687 RepID=A0A835MLA8_9ROSI|nr:hypothetical protein SADUNF_Sadunf19G0085500 [Salix dunnii]